MKTAEAQSRILSTAQLEESRFWSTVEFTDTCWLWRGPMDRHGYGKAFIGSRHQGAHRVSYQYAHGSAQVDLQLDHLCRVRSCVNPSHLEPVTNRENIHRAVLARTECRNGHALTADNVLSAGVKRCRTCRRDVERRKGEKKKRRRQLEREHGLASGSLEP